MSMDMDEKNVMLLDLERALLSNPGGRVAVWWEESIKAFIASLVVFFFGELTFSTKWYGQGETPAEALRAFLDLTGNHSDI